MAEEKITVERSSVVRVFDREEQTTFQKTQDTVFEKADFVRVFYEVKPNGS